MPTSFVITVRNAPVFVFFSVTVTPGNTPPVESEVTPVMVPVVSCAEAALHTSATSIISPSLRMRHLLRLAAYHRNAAAPGGLGAEREERTASGAMRSAVNQGTSTVLPSAPGSSTAV